MEKIRVVYDGLDSARLSGPGDNEAARGELGIVPADLVIGTVGYFAPLKGYGDLIETIPPILKELPRAKFLVVGESVYPAYRGYGQWLRRRVADRGLSAKVIFAGFRNVLPEIFSPIDIFVLPSISEGFGRLTRKRRLAPLFHYKLQDTPWRRCLPPSLWSDWEGEYHFRLRETVLNQERFRRLLEIFRDRGIEPVVIKGIHLAEVYYPYPVLRPMDDIDILIRKEDQSEVRQALAQEGWRFWEEAPGAHKAVFLNRDRGPRLFLEIHTDLQSPWRRDPSFSIEVADFHQAVRPGKLYGVEALVLEPTSNLLYLSYHNTHHDLFRPFRKISCGKPPLPPIRGRWPGLF